MSSLGPEAQELIRAGRSAFRATSADRERVASVLQSRLGVEAAALSAASATKAQALGLTWPALSVLFVGLAAGTVYLAGALRAGTPARDLASTTPAAAVAPAAPVELAALPPVVTEQTAVTPASAAGATADVTRAAARRVPADRLGEEVEILSRAQSELHASRFADSLRVLDEHARKFPRGKLAQERRAARIQALCGMGRTSEAEAELARLSRGSVHEGRARQACAAKN